MIRILKHLLGPLYTLLITVGSYSTSWAYFCTKWKRISFFPSKGKNWTFFKNRKLTFTWLRSVQHYRKWKSKPQSIFLTTHHDRLYPKLLKIFLCYFYEEIMHNSHFAAKKMKENVLNIEYDNNSLKTSSRCVLSIHNNNSSICAM